MFNVVFSLANPYIAVVWFLAPVVRYALPLFLLKVGPFKFFQLSVFNDHRLCLPSVYYHK